MPEYTQGIAGDGVAILKDGQPMTVNEIITDLKKGEAWGRTIYSRGWEAAALRIVEMGRETIGNLTEDDLAKFIDRISKEFHLPKAG